jgi:hypothetical protein
MTDDYVPANLHYRNPNEDLHERIPIAPFTLRLYAYIRAPFRS